MRLWNQNGISKELNGTYGDNENVVHVIIIIVNSSNVTFYTIRVE